MWKKLKRWSAMLLAAFLVIGSVEYTGLVAEAEGTVTSKYYTFNDVTATGGYQNTATVSDAGALSISYEAQYAEKQYSLPEGIDVTTITKIELGVTEGTATNLAVKLLVDGTSAQVNYDSFIDVTTDLSAATSVGIGIMNNATEAADYKISYIKITAVQTGGSDTEPGSGTGGGETTVTAKYYTFADVTATGGYQNTATVSDAGALSISYDGQYAEKMYSLPAGIDVTTITKIELGVTEGTASDLALKLYLDGSSSHAQVNYNSYIDVTTDLSAATSAGIGIMNNATEAADYKISYIKITAVQTGGSDTEPSTDTESGGDTATSSKYYTFNDVTVAGGYGYTADVSEAGVLTVAFNGQYQEVQYSLPEGVDATTLTNITLDVSSGHVSSLAIKILVDGAQKKVVYETNTINVTAEDVASGTITFAIMNKASEAIEGVTIDNIKITAVQTGGLTTKPDTGNSEGDAPAGEAVKYTFNDLEEYAGWSNTVTIDSNGKFSADFTGAYSQRYYKIPADIDMTKVQKVVFDGFTGSNYELRLLTQADVDGGYASTTVAVSSGNTLNVGANTDVKYVGFCCKSASADAPVTMTADSISFVLYPEGEEAPTTSTLVYNFVDIPISTYTDATYEVDDHGRVAFTCGGQYSYLAFTLPEEIADKKVTHMKLYFVDDPAYENTFNVCIYESTGTNPGMGSNGEQTSWGHNPANVIAVNADMKMVALKAPSAGMKAVLRKVEFTVEGTVTGGSDFISDMEYHFNPDKGGLEKKDGWQSVSSYLSSGRMTFNSSEQYGETRFVYPTELSEAVLKNVVLEISIGSVENLTIKLYTATDETGDGIINGLKPVQMVTGQSSFAVTATEPIAAIGFMNNAAADMDITIDKVTFTIDGDAEGGSTFEKVVNETIPVAAINPVLDAGVTVKDADATGNVVVNFVEQAKTAYFQIPTSVDMSKIKYFILDNLSSDFNLLATGVGTPLNGVQLAGYTAADFASGTPTITSDTSALFTNGRTDLKYFGLRSTAPTAGVSFDSIVFVQKNLTEAGDYKTWKADAFNGLAHANSTAGIVFDGVDKMTFTFNNPEDEAILRLPEGLNLANVDAFTFTFSANDTELNLNLYDADLNLVCGSGNKPYKKGNYWTIDRNMMGKASSTPILYIGVSAATDNPAGATCIFDGVSVDEFITPVYDGNFVVPEYTTITYTWKDMMKYEGDGWSGATWESTEDGLMINFGKGYGEVAMKLPAIIDLAQCETISVKMNGQTVPVAVKIKKNGDTYITNYDKIYGTRTFAPYTDAQVNKLSLMCLAEFEGANAKFESITFVMHGKYEPTVLGGDGIVINGDFMDPDVSDWKEACWDTATITAETSATPIYDNVTTYGNYANRTSPYQGFAQDLTGRVEQNETYKFSFWAKLSDDYKGAPDVQRVISFSPYTVDKDGVADYNPNLQGTYAQVCEVGEWTYYEGTWKVTNANEIGSVYIRIIEQGTNYGQGDCVLGDYAVTGVNIEVYVPEPPSIDEDVPNLKDELTADFGDDFIVGTAITGNEFDDIGVEMLANKHFNAITLGNELKPDALMGYSETHTALTTATINGQTIEVPTLKFSSADAKLDQILEWNADHPEDPIRVRGHVLVWHSQTMEWFFREGYVIGQNADGSENYVTPEVMNLRLEWYIKTVLEHYVGDDSKYKELFYGWDVVNEAVGDGTGRYRTNTVVKTELPSDTRHGSNSSWWAVYQSNEFIIKAFQYANKYAPADVELYYNDYNECDTKKVQGICKLLSDVLAAEGTRIDAMGMQAHYNIFNPGMGTFEKTIRAYCAVVGKVQLTELDLKASGDIGSESGLQSEYEKQAEHYNKIYNVLRKLDAEEGIEIGGVTFWGTIDTYSWLQSKSNVGGASDGTMKQCPLLFDGSYKVKPAYWAWVDYSVIDPDYVQEVYDGSTKPATPVEDDKAEDKDTEASSDSSESIEETTTVTVTVTPDDKKEGGSNVAPIAAGVAAAVVVVGAGVGAVVLKKKKGLPKKDK